MVSKQELLISIIEGAKSLMTQEDKISFKELKDIDDRIWSNILDEYFGIQDE